jgi:hypothetical protein
MTTGRNISCIVIRDEGHEKAPEITYLTDFGA